MNNTYKALSLFLLYTILLPMLIALGVSASFPNVSFITMFLTIVATSVLLDGYYKKEKNFKLMKSFTENYSKIPFKKYALPLNCQACNSKNVIEIDLDKNTEFVCDSCGKKNAIYIQFTTAIAAKHEKL